MPELRKTAQPIKRRLVIEIDDYCNIPFQELDLKDISSKIQKALVDSYNIRITDIKADNRVE